MATWSTKETRCWTASRRRADCTTKLSRLILIWDPGAIRAPIHPRLPKSIGMIKQRFSFAVQNDVTVTEEPWLALAVRSTAVPLHEWQIPVPLILSAAWSIIATAVVAGIVFLGGMFYYQTTYRNPLLVGVSAPCSQAREQDHQFRGGERSSARLRYKAPRGLQAQGRRVRVGISRSAGRGDRCADRMATKRLRQKSADYPNSSL